MNLFSCILKSRREPQREISKMQAMKPHRIKANDKYTTKPRGEYESI